MELSSGKKRRKKEKKCGKGEGIEYDKRGFETREEGGEINIQPMHIKEVPESSLFSCSNIYFFFITLSLFSSGIGE